VAANGGRRESVKRVKLTVHVGIWSVIWVGGVTKRFRDLNDKLNVSQLSGGILEKSLFFV